MEQNIVSHKVVEDPQLREFLSFCRQSFSYTSPAKIRLFDEHELSKEMKSMGAFFPDTREIWVLRGKRVRADWYRSLAHELVHHAQREKGYSLDGADGSDHENEANSKAAIALREWGRSHPEIYEPTV
jgi:hypothetical protein